MSNRSPAEKQARIEYLARAGAEARAQRAGQFAAPRPTYTPPPAPAPRGPSKLVASLAQFMIDTKQTDDPAEAMRLAGERFGVF